jgi:outer membrane protein assembly factor BamB
MITPLHPPAFRRWFLLLLALATASGGRAADSAYVRLLPNDGNNVYPATGLLRQWPEGGPRELWRVSTLGVGKSAVIESGGRAFTAAQVEGGQWAYCLDPATGKTLWRTLIATNENHHQVVGPVSSPVVDGDRVYFIPYKNNNGDIYDIRCPIFCLRAGDGGAVWSEGEQFFSTEGSTPLIAGNTLYVSSSRRDTILIAVNKMTGQLLWKTPEPFDAGQKAVYGAGSSLTYLVVENIPQIVVSVYRNDNIGLNANTGEVLWHWQLPTAVSSGMVATPVAVGSSLFFSGFQKATSLGVLVDLNLKDGKFEPAIRHQSTRLQCNAYHTISIVDGAAYGFGVGATNAEALQCTDFASGDLLWQQAGPEWSRTDNLTVADGLIFALDKKDELILAEANKTGYKELGRFAPGIKLGIQQQPTIFNGRLYLRGNDTIICYQISK